LFSDKGDRARPAINVRNSSVFLTFFWQTSGSGQAWAAKQKALMRETGVSDRLSQDDESMGQIKQEKSACEARGKLQRFFRILTQRLLYGRLRK